MTTETPKSDVAVAKVAKRTHFAPIWLIPILVGLVVIYVGYTTIRSHGKTVTLTFASGDGLAPGETTLKHKNVQLGVVEDVRLSDDLKHVDVTLKVNRHEAQSPAEPQQLITLADERLYRAKHEGRDRLVAES